MLKYVFSLKEDQIQIALVSKRGKLIHVEASEMISDSTSERPLDVNLLHANKESIDKVNDFFAHNKKSAKAIDFVIALQNVITRNIDLPYMKKKDLRDFIKNNISTYFTVNMDSYFYDYRILDILNDQLKGEKTMTVMIAVVPSSVLFSIKKLTVQLKKKLGKICIYPDVMLNLAEKNQDIAILDMGVSKGIVTIYAQGRPFLFTSIVHHMEEQDGLSELLDETEYFTNFFSTRHQGRSLESVIVLGKYAEDEALIGMLKSRLNIPVDEIDRRKWGKITFKQLESYADIITAQIDSKTIFNKKIDFSNEEKLNKKVKKEFKPVHLALILIMITFGWFMSYSMFLAQQEIEYLTGVNVLETSEGQLKINELKKSKEELIKKQNTLTEIENNKVNYIEIVDKLIAATPSNISISRLQIDHRNVSAEFNIDYSTIDAVELVIAINALNYFETVDIKELQLDDSNNSLALELVVR